MENFSKKNTNPNQPTNAEIKKIQETAYYLAEKNGFKGNSTYYRLEAERQVKGQAGCNVTNIGNRKR